MEDLFKEEVEAIGLDFGTHYSCIGVYRNGGVEIIPNSIEEKLTPSVVLFKDENVYVGEETTYMLPKNPFNYITEVKRLIGCHLEDKYNKSIIYEFPFKLKGQRDYPLIEIDISNKKQSFSSEEIIALIIKKMLQKAENYLNKKIGKIVITVPNYFTKEQRHSMEMAANRAGLEVLAIINDSESATLAYGFNNEIYRDKKFLVFDFGGQSLNVSLLSYSEKDYFVLLSTDGKLDLGGKCFTESLAQYIINKYNINNINKDKMKNNQAIEELKDACENVKKILSVSKETKLILNNFYDNKNINEKITRDKFEEICLPLFNEIDKVLENVLWHSHLEKKDIDEIILVGGSTRIPKVKEIIKKFFGDKININDSINVDEIVAYGAAVKANNIINGDYEILSNIIPFSLGIGIQKKIKYKGIQKKREEISIIIEKGRKIPYVNSKNYTLQNDYKSSITLKIYEGNDKYVSNSILLKELTFDGLIPNNKGEVNIIVEFQVNVDSTIRITIFDKLDKKEKAFSFDFKNENIHVLKNKIKKYKKKKMKKMKKKMKKR